MSGVRAFRIIASFTDLLPFAREMAEPSRDHISSLPVENSATTRILSVELKEVNSEHGIYFI